MNEKNLKPVRTTEEAKKKGRAGGLASAKAKKERKLLRETIETVLAQEIKQEEMKDKLRALGLKGKVTYADYLVSQVLTRTAERGSMNDLKVLSDLLGEAGEVEPAVLAEARVILDQVDSCID